MFNINEEAQTVKVEDEM